MCGVRMIGVEFILEFLKVLGYLGWELGQGKRLTCELLPLKKFPNNFFPSKAWSEINKYISFTYTSGAFQTADQCCVSAGLFVILFFKGGESVSYLPQALLELRSLIFKVLGVKPL